MKIRQSLTSAWESAVHENVTTGSVTLVERLPAEAQIAVCVAASVSP